MFLIASISLVCQSFNVSDANSNINTFDSATYKWPRAWVTSISPCPPGSSSLFSGTGGYSDGTNSGTWAVACDGGFTLEPTNYTQPSDGELVDIKTEIYNQFEIAIRNYKG